ncbi:MAG TPA: LLM class flavin-dependent oxidoreductase [Pseudomonadales bacterium]|nr:LLM class flavin-dependent oxidoreductase [Pseudomonadales bacterium]
MPLNIIGMIGVAPPGQTAVHVIGGGIDPQFLTDFARTHEQSEFDAVLVGYSASSAEGFQVAQFCANRTQRLKFLVAHRPGFVAPTLAARTAATFDNLTDGRLWLHVITGGVDADQRRDGDWLTHDERYARTDEYLDVLRRTWTSDKPFDYDGKFYRVARAYSEVRCTQRPHVPVWFGGVSDAAIGVGARHCDVYALFGESRTGIADSITRVRAAAAPHGRSPRFNVSFRPIIASTESAAWTKAREILAGVLQATGGRHREPEAETARRLIRLAAGGEIHDERLWTPIAGASDGSGNTTALVGTPDQVADAIAKYYELGVTGVLLRGFDPLNDAREYGRELIPAIRSRVAAVDARTKAPLSDVQATA